MKIGIIAPLWISVPPKNFGTGAQEIICHALAEGLVQSGHDVTLFASGDSETSARLRSVCEKQLMDVHSPTISLRETYELINLSEAYKIAGEFDIMHNHLLPHGLLFGNVSKTITLHTLHQRIYDDKPEIHLYNKFKEQNFISISDAQRQVLPTLNYVSTVYNGVDTDMHQFKDTPSDDYLLCIGRMRAYKGFHHAITAAQKLGKKLLIVAPTFKKDQHTSEATARLWDESYWQNQIRPHLNDTIRFIGEVEVKEKVTLMQNAKAVIFPVEREEPFGMTVIEAMSCGTPVIAYANGAMPELIKDGLTGYLVSNIADNKSYEVSQTGTNGLIEAIDKMYAMPTNAYTAMRNHSREHVVTNFSTEHMVSGYENVYKQLLGK